MRKEYDLTKLKSRKNPYAKHLKQQVTIRLGVDVISYFKELAEETGIPLVDDYGAVLADPQVEAVILCTPHSQHEEQVLAAVDRYDSKHRRADVAATLVEKNDLRWRLNDLVRRPLARHAGRVIASSWY